MDMATFKAAFRRAWLPAVLVLVAALFGSYVYVQKRIPPTAKASVAVRDPLTVNPGQYTSAQVSFDAIIKSDRLAENVQKKLGAATPSVSGLLSVEVVIPSNGINISPLYIVRAKDPDPARAVKIVETALVEARKMYSELNAADTSQLQVVDKQTAAAKARLKAATKALGDFNRNHGGDIGTQLSTLRAQYGSASDRLSQAQADIAAALRLNNDSAADVATARAAQFGYELQDIQSRLNPLTQAEPEYQTRASEVTQARSSLEQLTQIRQALSASNAKPVGEQIKVLDDAVVEGQTLMKILVYLLGLIVGLLGAMGVIYIEANRLRNRETTNDVIDALGAPTLGRIPRRAVVELP